MRYPLKLSKGDESFTIRDAAGTLVCCVYFDDGCSIRRQVRNRLDDKEAEIVAKRIARALSEAETKKEPPPPEGSGEA